MDILVNTAAGFVTSPKGATKRLVWVTARPDHQFHPEATKVAAEYSKTLEIGGLSRRLVPKWVESRMAELLRLFGEAKRAWQAESEDNANWACSRIDWFQHVPEVHETADTVYVFSYRWTEGETALNRKGYTLLVGNYGNLTVAEVIRRRAALRAAA